MQDQYLSAKCQSFNNIVTKHSNTVQMWYMNEPGHKLASLQWEIGASLICYKINKPSKPLWKIIRGDSKFEMGDGKHSLDVNLWTPPPPPLITSIHKIHTFIFPTFLPFILHFLFVV